MDCVNWWKCYLDITEKRIDWMNIIYADYNIFHNSIDICKTLPWRDYADMDWCGGQHRDMVVIWYGEFWQNNEKHRCKIGKTAQWRYNYIIKIVKFSRKDLTAMIWMEELDCATAQAVFCCVITESPTTAK